MVVGEPQILGQLKAAYAAAKAERRAVRLAGGLLTRAFSVAKRVRSETGIGQMAVSVSYAAVELARKIFGSLDQPHGHDCRGGEDVGTGRAPPAALRRFARLRHQPHLRARRGNGAAVPGHAGRMGALRRPCCPRSIS